MIPGTSPPRSSGAEPAPPPRWRIWWHLLCCRVTLLVLILMLANPAGAAPAAALPPPPVRHFEDRANWVPPAAATQFDARLAQFERDTSNQILVVILRNLPANEAIEDFTFRTAQSWRVGRADRDNGAALFVFAEDRKLYLQVGYGLEGALPDARAKQIIAEIIVPRFRAGDIPGGLSAGIDAILAAARGEYAGTGATLSDEERAKHERVMNFILFLALLLLLFWIFQFRNWIHRQTVYRRSGRSDGWGGWGGGSSGGSWGDGGGGGGGGGGFSGGGGSFGGGGAGGSW